MYELKLLVKLFPKFSHSVTAISSGSILRRQVVIEEVSLLDGVGEDSEIQAHYLISIYMFEYVTNGMQIAICICQPYEYVAANSSLVQNRPTYFSKFFMDRHQKQRLFTFSSRFFAERQAVLTNSRNKIFGNCSLVSAVFTVI